jgi:RHS repeat-associated protein
LTEALSCPASANNQLTTCFTYDAAGNLIKNGTATYTYDAENRIITTAGTSYIYDGDGQRIEKCTAGAMAGTCSTTATGTYYWKQGDGGTIAETDLHGNWTAAYGIIHGKIASRVDLPANTLHYYFNDHLGTTSVVTSAAGVVQKESDYFPYGGEIAIVSGDANRYKFAGKERDAESSLDFFGARYYASSISRWMSPDWASAPTAVPYAKFGEPQSLNLYSYLQNEPTDETDEDGHQCAQCHDPNPDPLRQVNVAGKRFLVGGGMVQGVAGEHYTKQQSNWFTTCPLTTCHTLNGLFPPAKPLYMTNVRELLPTLLLGVAGLAEAELAASQIAKISQLTTGGAEEFGMLRMAAEAKGMYGMGTADAATANKLGEAFAGSGAKWSANGKALVSSDGLRVYRPPTFKPNLGITQANFERYVEGATKAVGNGHLEIK